MISIVDYGVGNLGSIRNMLRKLDCPSELVSTESSIKKSSKLILPGVGAFDSGMTGLRENGLINGLEFAVFEKKVPILGICLGMQLMTRGSEEGKLTGLGWFDGFTKRFSPRPEEVLAIPHMGWNYVTWEKESCLRNDFTDESRFYFVHSYHVNCSRYDDVLMTTQYGSIRFHAAISKDNIYGCQFHPEKSHKFGLTFLRNFIEST